MIHETQSGDRSIGRQANEEAEKQSRDRRVRKKTAQGEPRKPRRRRSRAGTAMRTSASEPTTTPTTPTNGESRRETNGEATPSRRRRATAQSMAAKQRDISVSEFFAKNRHLLGFDNPRKALLTTVKEAVDNSLDACEEAGILPEIWVHIEADRHRPLQGRRAGQRPRHRQEADPADLRQAALRLEVSPPAAEPRAAGHRHQRGRHVRRADDRQAGEDHLEGRRQASRPTTTKSRSTRRRTSRRFSTAAAKASTFRPARRAQRRSHKHGIEWVEQPHGTRVTIELEAKFVRGRGSVDEYLRANGDRQPARRAALHRPGRQRARLSAVGRQAAAGAEGDQAASVRRRAGPAGRDAARSAEGDRLAVSDDDVFARHRPGRAQDLRHGQDLARAPSTRRSAARKPTRCTRRFRRREIASPATDCISPIGEELILKGLHQVVPGEFYAAATRPPAVYRGNPFQIEVGLAYGGQAATQHVTKELLARADRRDRRPHDPAVSRFTRSTAWAATRPTGSSRKRSLGTRQSPASLKPKEVEKLLAAMKSVNVAEGQTMEVLRYANRVPLQFSAGQLRDHADDHRHELAELRPVAIARRLPKGPVTVMVHMASVWVPFTSESKEAIASYPEIQKELRLGAAGGRPQAGHVRPQAAAR